MSLQRSSRREPSRNFFNSLFEDPFFPLSSPVSLRNAFVGHPLSQTAEGAEDIVTFTPSFDVKETDKAFLLEGELPGVEKDNLDIEFLDNNTLRVKGHVERSKEFQENGEPAEGTDKGKRRSAGYWATERVIGDFSRSFKFPDNVDPSGVTAGLKHGLLKISVPKAAKAPAAKKITIASSD
ncbi:HSP20-like chaperone [Lipomyces tetrasporus]|uniref:HSP20-like chaperone n=1 Tax=Lipomyces tetrasporus TaxID=54092 RepID=A0AAD7QLK6_9ASCO|nr:HSP20-like chaperone [Lipomyces tetrasporus]KAJ8097438.1 HSP20-like chaperone [Lipomyces tetrasporus]